MRYAPLGAWAQWSPDGQWVVFSVIPKGIIERADLFLARSDGSDLQQITFGQTGALQPTWSPDGGSIAYFSGQLGGLVSLRVDCYLDGTPCEAEPILLVSGMARWPDWSPDGSRIVFVRDDQLTIVSATTGSDSSKTLPVFGSSFCQSPQWSPDGLSIAANCYDGDRHSIILIDAAGTGQTNLTENHEGWCMEPKWSADGEQLAIVCRYTDDLGDRLGLGDSATATSAVYLLSRDGSTRTRVTLRDDEQVLWHTWIVPESSSEE